MSIRELIYILEALIYLIEGKAHKGLRYEHYISILQLMVKINILCNFTIHKLNNSNLTVKRIKDLKSKYGSDFQTNIISNKDKILGLKSISG